MIILIEKPRTCDDPAGGRDPERRCRRSAAGLRPDILIVAAAGASPTVFAGLVGPGEWGRMAAASLTSGPGWKREQSCGLQQFAAPASDLPSECR